MAIGRSCEHCRHHTARPIHFGVDRKVHQATNLSTIIAVCTLNADNPLVVDCYVGGLVLSLQLSLTGESVAVKSSAASSTLSGADVRNCVGRGRRYRDAGEAD